jgi:DMSO/TMAO reductase YedYZ heme-binding membrane subunit
MAEVRAAHETLSLLTLLALAVHALTLLGDGFLHPGPLELVVPFAMWWQRTWIALGVIGAWIMVLVGLSYYVRGRIGPALWKRLHRMAALGWLLGIVHAVAVGTDARTPWFLVALALAAGPALTLLAVRIGGARSDGRASAPPAAAREREAART